MLEKMQVSIYPQGGEPNPGWGGGAAATSGDTTPGRTHGQKVGTLEGGAEKRELTVPMAWTTRGHFHTEWHSGFWDGSCLKTREKIKNRNCMQSGWTGCPQPHGCGESLRDVPGMGWKESLKKTAPSWGPHPVLGGRAEAERQT